MFFILTLCINKYILRMSLHTILERTSTRFRAHKKAPLLLSLDVVLLLLEATTACDIAHPTTLGKFLFF